MRSKRMLVLPCLLAGLYLLGQGPDHSNVASSHSSSNLLTHKVSSRKTPLTRRNWRMRLDQMPLRFEANQGQSARQVKFLSRGAGYTLFLTSNEAVLALQRAGRPSGIRPPAARGGVAFSHSRPAAINPSLLSNPMVAFRANGQPGGTEPGKSLAAHYSPQAPMKEAVVRMKLVGANPGAGITGVDKLAAKSNYFVGDDPKAWHTNIQNYARVNYHNVYPGIDLTYYGHQGRLEYDFVVNPGASPSSISLALGSESSSAPLSVDAQGNLVVRTSAGEVRFRKPVVYQPVAGPGKQGKHFLDGRYALSEHNHVGFKVAGYDKTRPLVIDPVLVYSTYLGGSGNDAGASIAVDSSGSAYVTGFTTSADFPGVSGGLQKSFGGGTQDAFISKLNASGAALIYSTYLGGGGNDAGHGIAVDAAGDAYVTGFTNSPDYPTTSGVYRTSCGTPGYGNAMVSKLNPSGSGLVYSTCLDDIYGAAFDVSSIVVDNAGNAYLTGDANVVFGDGGSSPLGVFVGKLSSSGATFNKSTLQDGDFAYAIALDKAGNVYITGDAGGGFPITPGAYQTTPRGGNDAFVSKLSAANLALIYSTYLGGTGNDYGESISVDASGDAHVAGATSSTNFPVTNGAFQPGFGGGSEDGFVAKLNPSGSALVYSTYLGGSQTEEATGISVDHSGNASVTGFTGSPNFPTTTGAFQTTFGGGIDDVFFTKLNASGSNPVYSTYLGGSNDESGTSIVLDAAGNAYITGMTDGGTFPTTSGSLQTTYGGGTQDAFVAKFSSAIPFASFKGRLEINRDSEKFNLNATFTLGPGGSINLSNQPLTLTIRPYSVTVPPNAFKTNAAGYIFHGTIGGTNLQVVIVRYGGISNTYVIQAVGSGANLAGATNPVPVTLTIGDNAGTTQIDAQM